MTLPLTYLLTAPADLAESNPFGSGMRHTDLVAKLKKCNAKIECPSHEFETTTLWLGQPYSPNGRFLLALPHGFIPEFTQLDERGIPFQRGWRAVLEKLTRGRIISKARANKVFGIDLDADGWDGYCTVCRKENTLKKGVSKVSKLCEWHEDIQTEVNKEPDRERARWRPTGKVQVDYGNTSVPRSSKVRHPERKHRPHLRSA